MKSTTLIFTLLFSYTILGQIKKQNLEYDKLVNEGLELLIQQNILGAINKYKQAYKIDSIRVEANYGLGVAYLYDCQNKGANCFVSLSYLDTVISIDDTYRNCYYNRGNLKNMMLDYKGAIEDLNIAIIRKPNDASRYINRAFSYKNLNNHSKECEDLKKAAKLNNSVAQKKILENNCN